MLPDKVDHIFRLLLSPDEKKRLGTAISRVGSEEQTPRGLAVCVIHDREELHGITRERLRQILGKIDRKESVSPEELDAPPSILAEMRGYLERHGIQDRATYHDRIFGYTPDARWSKALETLTPRPGAETTFMNTMRALALTMQRGFSAPFIRRHKAFPGPLLRLTLGREPQANPVDEEYNEAGDRLFGEMDLQGLRTRLLVTLATLFGITRREELMEIRYDLLSQVMRVAVLRDGFPISTVPVLLRANDPSLVSTRGIKRDDLKSLLADFLWPN